MKCAHKLEASCDFSAGEGENGYGTVTGVLTIVQYTGCPKYINSPVMFTGELSGSSDHFVMGNHGLHVHSSSDMTSCSSLGGHFTVESNEIHGPPSFELPER